MKIAPMRANWARFSAVESGLAPMSSRTNGRPAEIIWTASAGRSMPGSVPRISLPAAIPAPVWPAVTTASASPVFDELGGHDDRAVASSRTRARAGCSSIPISSGAWTTVALAGRAPAWDRTTALVADEDDGVLGIRAGVREGARDDLRRAVVAAHRVDRDPDAGAGAGVDDRPVFARCHATPTRLRVLLARAADRLRLDGLAAVVPPARRAHPVRQLRLVAVRALDELRQGDARGGSGAPSAARERPFASAHPCRSVAPSDESCERSPATRVW